MRPRVYYRNPMSTMHPLARHLTHLNGWENYDLPQVRSKSP